MVEITEKEIGDTIKKLAERLNVELMKKTEEQLEEYWHFKWTESVPLEWNIYEFHDALKMYGSFCKKWEEKKNGSCCIVERVRDKYLMPKITEFVKQVQGL